MRRIGMRMIGRGRGEYKRRIEKEERRGKGEKRRV
jgi:hypothetical protein